ncbi:plastid-specific ribosomal protein 6 [Iris pallida]|uniref:Plastid-specific ribosomal protein 6 n=1 Tax=Iris pallida TaxID=29817 RepID=A0AAX6FNW3_IRIPA|nr:plastid-specific ribosomal protein 6 [Iris pallida]
MAMALGIISCGCGGGIVMMKKEVVGRGLFVECSSRPQKKATAHHMKTRPKKTQPWDVKRKGPTPYPPLPPLPPDWTLLESEEANDDGKVEEEEEEVLVSAAAAAAAPAP